MGSRQSNTSKPRRERTTLEGGDAMALDAANRQDSKKGNNGHNNKKPNILILPPGRRPSNSNSEKHAKTGTYRKLSTPLARISNPSLVAIRVITCLRGKEVLRGSRNKRELRTPTNTPNHPRFLPNSALGLFSI